MKQQIRKGVFETNSSSTHALEISFNDMFGVTVYVEEDSEYVCLNEDDVEWVMENIPTEILEKELKKRKSEENHE